MTNLNPAVSVPRRLELSPIPTIVGDTSLCSTKKAGSKDASCVSDVFEGRGQKRSKSKVSSTPMDDNQDDVISWTTQKSDGR